MLHSIIVTIADSYNNQSLMFGEVFQITLKDKPKDNYLEVSIYIYIYIERERERERETSNLSMRGFMKSIIF